MGASFDGCDYGKVYVLSSGLIMTCRTTHLLLSLNPDVEILSNSEVIIDQEHYTVGIESGSVEETCVSGSFNGCEYDKKIELVNERIFKCSTYRFHYAYSPVVQIVTKYYNGIAIKYIIINGDEYAGLLY